MKKNKFIVISIIVTILIICIGLNYIYSYYTDKSTKTNKFKIGNIEVTVTEPNYTEDENQPKTVKPKSEIIKDPTLENTGNVPAYIRAQIYVPMAKISYIDSDGHIITPESEVELFTYDTNQGWEEVEEDDGETTEEGKQKYFNGTYEDENGNKYKVHTYKFIEDGSEKIIGAGEKIGTEEQATPVFDKVTSINYIDTDKEINAQIYVCALAIQAEGGSAEDLWQAYVKQNGTGIVGVQ